MSSRIAGRLREWFSADELDIFLANNSMLRPVRGAVPSPGVVPLNTYTQAIADQLVEQELLTAPFWDALVSERPLHALRIHDLQTSLIETPPVPSRPSTGGLRLRMRVGTATDNATVLRAAEGIEGDVDITVDRLEGGASGVVLERDDA